MDFTVRIHQLTQSFPKEELFVLTNQIKRATDSIALNIAESSTGQSTPEFQRFLGYAVRSAIEVVACLHIARKRNLLADDTFNGLYEKLTIIIKMMQSLRNSLK